MLGKIITKKVMAISVVSSLFLVSSLSALAAGTPKYVFMFIGDGMGIAQRQIAELQLNNAPGKTAKDQKVRLTMNSLEVTGLNTTYDSTSIVPDSASTATSLASGYKTLSGVIGLREDKKTVTPLITESLKKQGYAIGIISTVKIVHATPAAYYAHIDSRNKYDEIAEQLINSKFDLFIGGGGNVHFLPNKRKDGRDLYAEASTKGFKVIRSSKDFLAAKPGTRVLANLPGDVNDEALPYSVDRQADDLSLEKIVNKSIELLSAKKTSFFMAIEEGKVDWACHANDTGSTIGNMLDFDRAIKVALNFKKKYPKQTLIIVTGDHECGGLGLSMGKEYRINPEVFYQQKLSFEVADTKIKRILENKNDLQEEIFKLAVEFGLVNLTEDEKVQIKKAIKDQLEPLSKNEMNQIYGGYNPISLTLCRLMNLRANLYWTSFSHTGIPVMLTAEGMGAKYFAGYKDNTDVCKITNQILKAGLKW